MDLAVILFLEVDLERVWVEVETLDYKLLHRLQPQGTPLKHIRIALL